MDCLWPVFHWGRVSVCVCVCLKRSSTCLSHVLPHGLALPPDFQYCMHTTAHTLTHSFMALWVSCGIIMQLENFQMVPWKADLSCALPRLDPPFNYASIIWLAESTREWAFNGLFALSVRVHLSASQLLSPWKHVWELKRRKWNFDIHSWTSLWCVIGSRVALATRQKLSFLTCSHSQTK